MGEENLDLALNFNDLHFAVLGAVIALICALISKYIFKGSEKWKYDLSLLAILFAIVAIFCLAPLALILMRIGLWLLLVGIVMYIGYKLLYDSTK